MSIEKDGIHYSTSSRLPANAENSFQYLLVRLLIGALQISKNSTTVKQEHDLYSLPYSIQTQKPTDALIDFLSSSGIGSNLQRFIKVTRGDNRDFYRDLLAEFANYFIQTKRKNHATAFIHLYRILERLSYSTPLLYCATQKDFINTFNDLKLLFTEDLQGELGFLKKFLDAGKFIDHLKLNITFNINFSSTNGYQSSFYDLTKRLYKDFVSTDPASHTIEIKFKNIPNLITAIRNRVFHARTGDGRSNAKMQEMLDIDEYFGCMNLTFCNVLAIISLQTIIFKYQPQP